MTLRFSEKAHRYTLDGKPCPGVTTLIGKGVPKEALPPWAARTVAEYVADNEAAVEQLRTMGREPMVSALKSIPWEARDQAAIRGTDVHALAEQVVQGVAVDVPEHLVMHVAGYADWLDDFGVTAILTERSGANRQHWYAGRFDLIADIGPTRWLLDAKTSKTPYGEIGLQLGAYRNFEFYVDDGDPDTEHPMPEVERVGVIHITDYGTTLIPYDSTDAPFRDFLHAAWTAKRRKAIDGYKHEPITDPAQLRGTA